MALQVESLYIYPVKSLGVGVAVNKLQFDSFGVKGDRQFLIINARSQFITQRSHALLSQFEIQNQNDGWLVSGPSGDVCVIPSDVQCGPKIHTHVWRAAVVCREVELGVSAWFSKQLGEPVKLVSMDNQCERYATTITGSYPLAFADGYPLLVCNQKSLETVNSKMDLSIGMERFRPNVVYSSMAESEYTLAGLHVTKGGEIKFVKPCVRCNIPAIEPSTSVYQKEVHSSLKTILRRDDAVVFGMNAVTQNLDELVVGDKLVEIPL